MHSIYNSIEATCNFAFFPTIWNQEEGTKLWCQVSLVLVFADKGTQIIWKNLAALQITANFA